MRLPNYIEDENPFHLAGPPVHWLRALWDFDNSLVVVPSRQGFYYRLSQRRKPNLPTNIVNDALFKESDTKMLASYNLVPVTTILATANWSNPLMFEELRRRAPWRLGGADEITKQVEEQEQKAELEKQTKTDEILTDLGKDGWGLYRKKIGLQSHMWVPRSKGVASEKKAPSIKVSNKSSNKPEVSTIFIS